MLEKNEEFDKLRSKVLRYSLYKKRTEKEVHDKFINENQAYMDAIIEFLIEDEYLDENKYIEEYVYESTLLRNQSIKAIEYKLIEKGIDKNKIRQYLSVNDDDLLLYEIKSAKNLLKKRENLDAEKNISYLLNKGYRIENIRKAVEELAEIED